MSRPLSSRLAAAACTLLLCGCVSSPTIDVRHDPIYRAEPHTSTIYVTATSDAGIDRIVVDLVIGDLVVCTQSSLPSIIPCRANGQQLTFTCNFHRNADTSTTGSGATPVGAPKTATCPVSRPLDTLSLLTYRATATDTRGKSASTNFITYSGGAPPPTNPGTVVVEARIDRATLAPRIDVPDFDGPDFERPPPLRPTASDVLRPIWLVSDVPPAPTPQPDQVTGFIGAGASRIDVAFMPDPDWGADYRGFSDGTGRIANTVLFEPPAFGQDYRLWRDRFWYWVGPAGADGVVDVAARRCEADFSSWALAARAVTDGQAIVNRTESADCSNVNEGWGLIGGREELIPGHSGYAFVHESGHFLHCMGDEYGEEQYVERYSCSDPPNTFPAQAECEQIAAQYGYPTEWCARIPGGSYWRITNGDPEIMDGVGSITLWLSTDWQDTNHDAILKRMAACLQGACW